MTAHLRMDAPDERNRLDDMVQGVLGQPLDRPEGRLKVTGRAPYAAEVLPEGLAYGVLVRATVTHGRLRDLAAEDVQAMPGVLAVLSDPRMLRNPAQGTAGKAPVQGPDEIFYFGQPIALVVAESFEQARHAAQSLHPTFDILDGPTEPEGPDLETERPKAKQSDQGDIDEAMAKAAFTIDQTWRTPGHGSAAMEPHAAIAAWDGDTLTLRGSYQMLKYNRNELADALGIKPKHIRLLSPFVGGGFGSKLGISHEAVAAALAARELGRPVMVVALPPAGLRGHHAPLRDPPAHPPRGRPRRPPDRHLPREPGLQLAGRELFRARRPGDALPLRRRQSPGDPRGRPGAPDLRRLGARPGRGGGRHRARERDGRAGRGGRPRSDRAAPAQHPRASPRGGQALLHPHARRGAASRRRAVRLEPPQGARRRSATASGRSASAWPRRSGSTC